MRDVALGTVRDKVKAATRRSLASGDTAQDLEINQTIFDVQQWLASEYDWPFLKSRWDIAAGQGNRYIAFPTVNDVSLATAINFERPTDLYVKWNNIWQVVDYGITELEEFNYLDPDQGVQSDPIQRWQFDDESNFEIWPLPATSSTLRFVGQRALTELRSVVGPPAQWNDSATLDLDDMMVTYFAATEYLIGDEDPKTAEYMLNLAKNRMSQIRQTYPTRQKAPCIIGRGQRYDKRWLRLVPMVVVATNKP